MALKKTRLDEFQVKKKLTSADSVETIDSFESDEENIVELSMPTLAGYPNSKRVMNATCIANPKHGYSSDSINTNDSFESDEESFASPNKPHCTGKENTDVKQQHVYQMIVSKKTCEPGCCEPMVQNTVRSNYTFSKHDSSESDEEFNRMLKRPLVGYASKTSVEHQKNLTVQGCDSSDSDEDCYHLLNTPQNGSKTKPSG